MQPLDARSALRSCEAAPAPLLVTRPRPGVVLGTLHRPGRMNALNEDLFAGLGDLCASVGEDASVRAVVLTGSDQTFCSGYDLDEVARISELQPVDLLALLRRQASAISALRDLPQPVIAAVDGVAVGAGLSLALAADIRVVTARARFQASFVKLGLSGGDMGASWLLPRIAGLGFASEMLLTGRLVNAEEALTRGLVSRLTSAEDLMTTALELAEVIARNSPVSVRLTKQVLQSNVDAPSLAVALEREAPLQVIAAGSLDVQEAVAAFRARRSPRSSAREPVTDPVGGTR